MELFAEIVNGLNTSTIFAIKVSSYIFEWVLNKHMINEINFFVFK